MLTQQQWKDNDTNARAGVTIRTNNKPRPLLHGGEIPFSLFLDNGPFSYVIAENGVSSPGFSDYRFFQYKGEWYDSNEFTGITTLDGNVIGNLYQVAVDSPLAKWDGIEFHTYGSGLLFRFVRDDYGSVYNVVVGRFF